MVSQNRILTVSYGTFSCTLEGFDDPFGTMKAIAEYFRDLAAEDRYFGAEPPQPDAAMLHRIAEREIQRRVEAKIQDNGNGVILRAAAEPAPQSAPVADVPPVVAAVDSPAPASVAPAPEMAVPAEDIAEDIAIAEPAPRLRAVDDDVAAKLARIRAAVGRGRPVLPLGSGPVEDAEEIVPLASGFDAAGFEDDGFDAADLGADDDLAAVADLAPALEPEQVARMVAAISGATEARDASGGQAAGTAVALPDTEISEQPAAMTAAAEIAGLEVEVPATEAPLASTELPGGQPEEQPAAAPTAARREPAWMARRRAAREAQLAAAQAEAASAEAPPPASAEDFDLDALEATFAGLEAEAAAEAAAEPQPDLAEPLASVEPAPAEVSAEVTPPEPDLSAILGAISATDPEPAPEPVVVPQPESADVDALLAQLTQDTPPVAAAQELRAPRVIRVRRVPATEAAAPDDFDLDALQEQLAGDRTAPLADDALAVNAQPLAVLAEAATPAAAAQDELVAAAAEDDLAAVLDIDLPDLPVADLALPEDTAVEDLPPAATGEPPAAVATVQPTRRLPARPLVQRPATQRPATPRPGAAAPAGAAPRATGTEGPSRPVRPERSATPRPRPAEAGGKVEVPVDRLLRQADTEMSDAANQQRSSTIAHLKAAMAATVADRLSPQGAGGRADDDTAAYRSDLADVVQRRPDSPAGAARVPPLVLVSAQRIDTPAAVAAPLRPRRVSGAALALDPLEDEELDTSAEDARDNLFGGAGSLAEYLIRQGSSDLADRMEATAAWLVAVEGRDEFNRPQLMRLAGIDEAAESREAAMIAFGVLLREGRIERSRRGQFCLPGTSEALAEARSFAG